MPFIGRVLQAHGVGDGVWAFLDPGGVAACSRWLSVVCDTTGTEILQFRTPAGVPASCRIKALAPFRGPSRVPSRVRNLWRIFPVVSQKTLNHRLPAATPPGVKPGLSPSSPPLCPQHEAGEMGWIPPAIAFLRDGLLPKGQTPEATALQRTAFLTPLIAYIFDTVTPPRLAIHMKLPSKAIPQGDDPVL